MYFKNSSLNYIPTTFGGEPKLDIKSIKPIARLGYYDYTVVNEIFEMKAPAASKEELAGLEGRNFDNQSDEKI